MVEKKEKKEKPAPKALDKEDWKNNIDLIVDQLTIQSSSRDVVTEIVNALHEKYGVKKPTIRKVASIIYKQQNKEIPEEHQEIEELVDYAI